MILWVIAFPIRMEDYEFGEMYVVKSDKLGKDCDDVLRAN